LDNFQIAVKSCHEVNASVSDGGKSLLLVY